MTEHTLDVTRQPGAADRKGPPRWQDLPRLSDDRLSACSWTHFGPGDQFGTLNRITPERIAAAAALVSAGKRFPINWKVEYPNPPLFSRSPVTRTAAFGYGFADDKLDDFYLQGSTQWDALTHAANPVHGFYQNPKTEETGLVAGDLGMHVWARSGIAARFVLADVARWRESVGRPIDPSSDERVSVDDVRAALDAQGTPTREGDILLIRFGWISWYEDASESERQALSASQQPASPGLAPGSSTCQWLWDSGFAAVAGDNPAVEATPTTAEPYESLHFTLLPLLGMPLGELFDLEALADDCLADGCYEGLLVSAPINAFRAVGSPANAVCLK